MIRSQGATYDRKINNVKTHQWIRHIAGLYLHLKNGDGQLTAALERPSIQSVDLLDAMMGLCLAVARKVAVSNDVSTGSSYVGSRIGRGDSHGTLCRDRCRVAGEWTRRDGYARCSAARTPLSAIRSRPNHASVIRPTPR